MLLRDPFYKFLSPRIFFAPDDGGGDGGGDPPAKTFTQADLDKIVQERLGKIKRDNDAKDKQILKMGSDLDDLRNQIAALSEEKPPVSDPNDLKGKLELMESRYKKQIDDLNKKIGEAELARRDEHSRRLETERDKELSDGLAAAQCKDSANARYIFLPRIKYDDTEQKWLYHLVKGGTVSIADGVAEEMPDYLKPASLQGGGSGSSTGSPKRATQMKAIDHEKKILDELEARAKKSGRMQDVAVHQKQKRKVQQLERELSAA